MSQAIVYKEWLPDQPEMGGDHLVEANNVIPDGGAYKPFKPLAPVRDGSFTLPGIPSGGFVAELDPPTSPSFAYYAATSSQVYMANPAAGSGTFNARASGWSTTSPINDVSFAQFDNLVFLARGLDGVQFHTAGSATNFATVSGLTGLRDGRYLGVVNRFLIVGNLGSATTRASTIEWSAIDDPTNFPTVNSATAIATQSGEQVLSLADGPVVGIYGGDQYGLVIQTGAITRMTYVGPPVVFQFDRLDQKKGQARKYGSCVSGQIVYMQASDGFYRSDGVSMMPIGEGRVNKTFIASAADDIGQGATTAGAMMDCAFHHMDRTIYWSFPVGSVTNNNKIYVYSEPDNRWTSADQEMRTFIEPSPSCHADGLYAFNSSNVLCKFSGTAGAATITTSESELNPGGRFYIDGIKPNVESSGTAPSMTVRVGYRDALSTAPTYTSATSANSATGFADFRVDAKYHRAEVTITGNFDKTSSLVVKGRPAGKR